MQDCWECHNQDVAAVIKLRLCPDHGNWVVYAWAKIDGDHPFVPVHPMWEQPRTVPDDEYASGTLQLLLTAAQQTVRRLVDESATGQMTLW